MLMERDKIIFLRNFLFRAFVIGWQNATPDAWHAGYLVLIGFFIFT
jgi:hypothetical protein